MNRIAYQSVHFQIVQNLLLDYQQVLTVDANSKAWGHPQSIKRLARGYTSQYCFKSKRPRCFDFDFYYFYRPPMESENQDKNILVFFVGKRLLYPTNSHIGKIKHISLQTAKSLFCIVQLKKKRNGAGLKTIVQLNGAARVWYIGCRVFCTNRLMIGHKPPSLSLSLFSPSN